MSTRWFFSSALVGASASTVGRDLPTSVTFRREIAGSVQQVGAPGPVLRLVGPGDVLGFDRSMVLREEPPPGAAPAPENVLASIDLAHADLPWLLSPGSVPTPSGSAPQPWLVLVVLAEDEADPPRDGDPLPVLTAPVAALPPLSERWAWAHVEARLGDEVRDVRTARTLAEQGVRRHSADVVGRLLCPRRLAPDRGWLAAVVPATEAGRAAGLNTDPAGSPTADAWRSGAGGSVELPVYHWWRFRTGPAGTFEELARRLHFQPAAEAGLGGRTVDVGRPWPGEDGQGPATVRLDGALRIPGSAGEEVWSDPEAQDRFRARLQERLEAAGQPRRQSPDGREEQPQEAVGPPLYGSHHTGQQSVPGDPNSWLATLNLEVRRRVAAALGVRYVQEEQEFLMARAWEQAGQIRQANRLLAVSELAAVVADRVQRKHLDPLEVADLLTVMAPAGDRVRLQALPGLAEGATLTTTLAASRVPTGAASSAFSRLTRPGGALSRRASRIAVAGGAGAAVPTGTVITNGLAAMGLVGDEQPGTGLGADLMAAMSPVRLQVRRLRDRIPAVELARRSETDPRPLGPIMAHPHFAVPLAEELLSRWPEWAVPGLGALAPDTVTLLETNPEFVAAVLVGVNHEFNAELLWREFPTDQRGTSFARFWPSAPADIDEIARWPLDTTLGSRVLGGEAASLALLVRGELLRRFPGTALLAIRGEAGRLPVAFNGLAATPLVLDESTVLYLFAGIDEQSARAGDWFFVFREPMRGTQFGFDSGQQPARMATWADLTWAGVHTDGSRSIRLSPGPDTPQELPGDDPPLWGRDAADMARIAFQQPFQLAFRAAALLGG